MPTHRTKLCLLGAALCLHCGLSAALETAQQLDDGWTVSTPAKEHFDAEKFRALDAYIEAEKRQDLIGVSVFRNNRIVYDKHLNGATVSTTTDIRSATKSITSLLLGIAIDQGVIAGVEEKILPYFDAYRPIQNLDERKRNVRIRDLLSMSAGFDSDDDVPESKGNENNLDELSGDWVRYAIDVPMLHAPGEHWAYSSMNTFLLGYIIEQASGEPLESFARKHLFDPLGIKNFTWRKTPTGHVVAQGNFKISTRDMGKIAHLMLNRGRHNGRQIVSAEWIAESIQPRFEVPWANYDSYGYQWYNHALDIDGVQHHVILASGNGGNKLYIVPEQRLVVTVASTAYGQGRAHHRALQILRLVLASMKPQNDAQPTAQKSDLRFDPLK